MSSPTNIEPLEKDAQGILLDVARRVILHGVAFHALDDVDPDAYPPVLQEHRSSFVTLLENSNLRGCMGNLHANRPLVLDVAHNAFAAAFEDPRFPPLDTGEENRLDIHISVLEPQEELPVDSLADLQQQLQPGVDGLFLEEHEHKATFLPSVWASLGEPEAFTRELLKKGGWPGDYWSAEMRAFRYRVQEFS